MKIAVVIPALDEAGFVERAVSSALDCSLDRASGADGTAADASSSATAEAVSGQRVGVSERRDFAIPSIAEYLPLETMTESS